MGGRGSKGRPRTPPPEPLREQDPPRPAQQVAAGGIDPITAQIRDRLAAAVSTDEAARYLDDLYLSRKALLAHARGLDVAAGSADTSAQIKHKIIQSATGARPETETIPGAASTEPAPPAVQDTTHAEVGQAVRDAYRRLASEPGDFVLLTDLRRALPDVPRADLDVTLDRMYQDQQINLVAQADQMSLTDADRQASLRVGSKNKHRISFDPYNDP